MTGGRVVYGVYKTRLEAEEGVGELHDCGFRSSDVSILLPDPGGDFDSDQSMKHTLNTDTAEKAGQGAGAGALIGGAIGMIAGVTLVGVPGLGALLAAGPVMMALSGAGVGGAVGGLAGALRSFGVIDEAAVRFEGHVREGGILVLVHADDADWAQTAAQVLRNTGASDVDSTPEVSPSGSSSSSDASRTSQSTSV